MSNRRDIATKWTCSRSGDCCLQPELVVTPFEAIAMQQAKSVVLNIQPMDDPRFVRVLTPAGCPFLDRELDGKAVCAIYEARPYTCRRFQCLRPDPSTEAFEPGGPMGCRNLSDRLDQSLHALEFFRSNQRRAQREWADSHGWHR